MPELSANACTVGPTAMHRRPMIRPYSDGPTLRRRSGRTWTPPFSSTSRLVAAGQAWGTRTPPRREKAVFGIRHELPSGAGWTAGRCSRGTGTPTRCGRQCTCEPGAIHLRSRPNTTSTAYVARRTTRSKAHPAGTFCVATPVFSIGPQCVTCRNIFPFWLAGLAGSECRN